MSDNDTKISQLLYPNLMSDDQLRNFLKMRYIKMSNIDYMNRSELLDIYSRVVLPLQQRAIRNKNDPDVNAKENTKSEINVSPSSSNRNGIRKIRSPIDTSEECKNKLIKLNIIDDKKVINLKRPLPTSNPTDSGVKKPRQKITWP